MRPPTLADDRSVGVVVLAVSAVALVVASALLVPWQPVPGGAPTPVEASALFTPDEIARAEHYSWWARAWSWSSLATQLLLFALLALPRVRNGLVSRLPGPWWAQVALAVVVVSLVVRLASLPFAAALQQHRLDHGLATQSWLAWIRDLLVGEAVAAGVTTLALVGLVGLARRFRRAWPALAALGAGTLVVVGSLTYPLLVEPLFNDFEPLPEGSLRTSILQVADREGVEVDEVLVADASRRTTSLNAYVSGLGATRRVVVYDTLVETLPEDQALSVVAHEVAHAQHHDVMVGTGLGALGAASGVGLLGLLLGGRLDRSRPGSGSRASAPAVVPLLLALVAAGSVLSSPLENGVSRRIETRADVVALATTQDPDAFVEMQRMLALRSLADPTPPVLAHWWWGSHPTVVERVALASR